MSNSIEVNSKQVEVPAIKKWFSVFLALYPVLCIYKAFLNFTIGDVILILFLMGFMVTGIKINKSASLIAVFCFIGYAMMSLIFNMMTNLVTDEQGHMALMFRFIKFMFYMVCVFTCSKQLFNTKIFQKTLYAVSIFACIFLIIQYIIYYGTGTIVVGHIPGLNLYLEEYAEMDYKMIYNSLQYRPSSIFLEPAGFAQYVVNALIFVMLSKEKHNGFNDRGLILLFTVGIVMCTSGQGIVYLAVVYIIYFTRGMENRGIALLFAFFAAIIIRYSFDNVVVFREAVERLSSESASEARLGTYDTVLNLQGAAMFFGYGYGSFDEWMAGAAYIWYGCGIVGLVLVFLIFLAFYKESDNLIGKSICIIFFIMFFGTGLFYNYMLFWFFSMVLCTKEFEGELENENSIHTGSVQTQSIG